MTTAWSDADLINNQPYMKEHDNIIPFPIQEQHGKLKKREVLGQREFDGPEPVDGERGVPEPLSENCDFEKLDEEVRTGKRVLSRQQIKHGILVNSEQGAIPNPTRVFLPHHPRHVRTDEEFAVELSKCRTNEQLRSVYLERTADIEREIVNELGIAYNRLNRPKDPRHLFELMLSVRNAFQRLKSKYGTTTLNMFVDSIDDNGAPWLEVRFGNPAKNAIEIVPHNYELDEYAYLHLSNDVQEGDILDFLRPRLEQFDER